MVEVFGITQSQADRIADSLRAHESGEASAPPRSRSRVPPLGIGDQVIFGILESEISAVSGMTGEPNSGTLSQYTLTSSGGTTDTGEDITVYSFATVAATTDQWSFCTREQRSGLLMLSQGQSSTSYVVKLGSDLVTGDSASATIWKQSATDTAPSATATTKTVWNLTGQTLKSGKFHIAEECFDFVDLVIFPRELAAC